MTAPGTARVPPPWAAIVAIGLNTFREAIRDRVLYLLLVFALVVIGASRLLALLTVGSEDKIIKDLGLSAISIFGILTAVFLGVSLVFKEIDKRTIFTLLANPVPRWQFVLGKYLGLMAVLTVNVTLMSLVLGLILGGGTVLALCPAVTLTVVELALVTAFALLFSSFTNPGFGTGTLNPPTSSSTVRVRCWSTWGFLRAGRIRYEAERCTMHPPSCARGPNGSVLKVISMPWAWSFASCSRARKMERARMRRAKWVAGWMRSARLRPERGHRLHGSWIARYGDWGRSSPRPRAARRGCASRRASKDSIWL